MSYVSVYRGSVLLETIVFRTRFMVLDLDGNLHWHSDEELEQAAKGTIQVWARHKADTYKIVIVYVLPSWTLSIDNISFAPQLYEDIEIGNRLIKLSYQDYEFVFYEQADILAL